MIEMKHNMFVLKCPGDNCTSRIRVSEGKFVGGINDKGGLIIKCSVCESLVPIKVKNPLDASGVISGGEIIDSWDDEITDENDVFERHGIDREKLMTVEKLLVLGYEDEFELPEFKTIEKPVFTDISNNYENLAYEELEKNKQLIEGLFRAYSDGFYIQGKDQSNWSAVLLNYEVNGVPQKACFAKSVNSENDLNIDKLYLIGHSNTDLKSQINGIYTKNNCLNFLERMLNRWRYTASEVLIVVPFIGYTYNNSLPQVKELWEWLQQNMDITKTNLITRKGTFKLFQKAQSNSGIEYDFLVDWGLLEPLIESMEEGKMTYFERSHAKYYVGVFDDKVEILSGSFNIHKGPSFENISFECYKKDFFLERYLHMFKKFNYSNNSIDEPVHIIEIEGGLSKKNYVYSKTDFFSLWDQLH